MECLEVGKVKSEFKGLVDGVSASLTESGIVILASYAKPSEIEVANYREGDIEFKLIVMGNLVWLLLKVGKEEWSDMPITVEEGNTLDEVLAELDDENKGYSASVILTDTLTGEVKALRLIGTGHKFSRELNRMMCKVEPIEDASDLIARVIPVHSRYSTKELVKLSNVRYVSGTLE